MKTVFNLKTRFFDTFFDKNHSKGGHIGKKNGGKKCRENKKIKCLKVKSKCVFSFGVLG